MAEKVYYIKLNFDEVLTAYENERFSEDGGQNGYLGIHIEPGLLEALEKGLTRENTYYGGVKFFQNGNYYAPGSGYISEFGVGDFFGEDAMYNSGAMSETLSQIRSDAREQWMMDQEFEIDLETVNENYLDESWVHYEAVQKVMEEWEEQAISYFREQATANRLNEVRDDIELQDREDSGNATLYVYKIVWED